MALLRPVIIQAQNSTNMPLSMTMRDIRSWLDSEQVHPIFFKTVVGRDGLGFEISFRDEREAERFQERFASGQPRPDIDAPTTLCFSLWHCNLSETQSRCRVRSPVAHRPNPKLIQCRTRPVQDGRASETASQFNHI